MAEKKLILKPMGAWYMLGGILTIITAVTAVLVQFKLGTLLAIPVFILLVLVGSMELSAGRSIYRMELGSWRSNLTTAFLSLLARGLFIYLLWGEALRGDLLGTWSINLPWDHLTIGVWTFYLNVVVGLGELVLFVLLARRPDDFMLPECDEDHPDLATCKIKSVSECPHCHEVVETYWQSCPYCGTPLPRVCGVCGNDLGEMLTKCSRCGTEVMPSLSLQKTINMFQKLTEEDAMPETKAIHHARLAEALLKNGQAEEAVRAYRQAVSFTKYPRKRTNFMVQAARILKNTGHTEEAIVLLDEALSIDPADYAGATKVKAEITSPQGAPLPDISLRTDTGQPHILGPARPDPGK